MANQELDALQMRVEELCESLFCQYDASEQLLEVSRARSDALQNVLSEKEITIAEVQRSVACARIVCK